MSQSLNDTYRELFVKKCIANNKLSAVIDDNKQHVDMKKASDNLETTRHVRDNYQGLACHKAASVSNNFVIGTQCERLNDTSSTTCLRLVNNIFIQVERP